MTASTAPAPATTSTRLQRLDDDARQLIAVLVTAVVAIAVGWLIVTAASPGARSVEIGGIKATVPAGWIVRSGAGDVRIIATDPRVPGVRLSVSRPAADPDAATPQTPASIADRRIAARASLLEAFSVLSREALPGDAEGEALDFTWAAIPDGEPVVGMQGREVLTAADGTVTIVTLEAPSAAYDSALTTMESFAASIQEVAS